MIPIGEDGGKPMGLKSSSAATAVDQGRGNLLKYLCCSGLIALVPIAIVNCYVFLVYSSLIDQEAVLYSLHSASLGANISTRDCDLSKGKWIPEAAPPLYTNETCRYIQGHQNCLKNGRPDRGFLAWRWRPDECDLPRFDPALFLRVMRNKRMIFFGDSIARNHMQSLLCAISQVEEPRNLYRDPIDKDVIWLLPSFNFTLAIFWSPFLVKHEQRSSNGSTIIHIHLDTPEEIWMSRLHEFHAIVLSSGPWFFKPSVYYRGGSIVGCHHCGDESIPPLSFIDAYRMALGGVLDSIAARDGYAGTTFLRTFSAEHFENGEWWNGGTCNRTEPFRNQSAVELPWMASEMRRIQVEEFDRAAAKNPSRSKLKLVDVSYSAYLRPDGHPGVFRSSRTLTPDGSAVQSDCLHWCLPGPIDMWNEILLKTLLAREP
ncbi:protein trichome birefringence-like 25 [Selaginella moellendorffii]|nr:protein trichome birefringence-like 25 [Selaginella moellendorffii]|eukprot:XP_002984022.2 protein trichome birefringence-like 25 [Selaginella moellendorffii]